MLSPRHALTANLGKGLTKGKYIAPISDEMRAAIKADKKIGMKNIDIAKKYGVHYGTVSKILHK